MNTIIPLAVTSSILTASNVPTTDHAAWSSGTTYAQGARVVVLGSTNKIYESAQGSNTNHSPTEPGSIWWTEIGAINRYKAFDGALDTSATRANTITYTLEPNALVTAIAFFAMNATSIRVRVKDAAGAIKFDVPRNLLDASSIRTFYDYVNPIRAKTSSIVTDIVCLPGWSIELTIDNGSNTASVGYIGIGRLFEIGESGLNTETPFRDFSRVTFDEFGDVSITRRRATRNLITTVAIPTTGAGAVMQTLSAIRATVTPFWTHTTFDQLGTGVVGILRQFRPSYNAGPISYINLEIEGIT